MRGRFETGDTGRRAANLGVRGRAARLHLPVALLVVGRMGAKVPTLELVLATLASASLLRSTCWHWAVWIVVAAQTSSSIVSVLPAPDEP